MNRSLLHNACLKVSTAQIYDSCSASVYTLRMGMDVHSSRCVGSYVSNSTGPAVASQGMCTTVMCALQQKPFLRMTVNYVSRVDQAASTIPGSAWAARQPCSQPHLPMATIAHQQGTPLITAVLTHHTNIMGDTRPMTCRAAGQQASDLNRGAPRGHLTWHPPTFPLHTVPAASGQAAPAAGPRG
jgi:hypothetical protein